MVYHTTAHFELTTPRAFLLAKSIIIFLPSTTLPLFIHRLTGIYEANLALDANIYEIFDVNFYN